MNSLIYFIFFLFSLSSLNAQIGKENYFPPSPEANALIKINDIPVNYSTGLISNSIPIHTVKLKSLEIPILLSYKSSGLKPSEIASNVGYGWDLSAGGTIIQNVVGNSDLHGAGSLMMNNLVLPVDRDLKLPGYVPDYISFNPSPKLYAYRDSLHLPHTDYSMIKNLHQNNIDSQPDIFYYQIPAKSGKFYIAGNNDTRQIPFSKNKIEYENYKFKITDIQGNKYEFNTFTDNINYTSATSANPNFISSSSNFSRTYYLTKIVTVANEEVNFLYENTVKYNLINDTDYTKYVHDFYDMVEKTTSYHSEVTSKILTKIIVNSNYEINFKYNKYRKDIQGPLQEFAPKTLDIIEIRDGINKTEYFLKYGYFGKPSGSYNSEVFDSSASVANSNFRLKLISINRNNENPYIFTYHNEAATDRLTDCRDHWGYYNSTCQRYIGNSLFGNFNTISKDPDLQRTMTNILANIQYPTKGKVAFSYELNDFQGKLEDSNFIWEEGPALYSNTDDVFTGELKTQEILITIPEYVSIPRITYNLVSPGGATTTNQAYVTIYDSQNQLVAFSTPGVGLQDFTSNDLKILQRGETYRIVLSSYHTIENQDKFFKISFLIKDSYDLPSNYSKVGGLRIKNIKYFDNINDKLEKQKSFSYSIDNLSSGVLYEIPRYLDVYSYYKQAIGSEPITLNHGHFSFAVQHSRMPVDLFGFGGHHIFYKKVTESEEDIKENSPPIKTEKYFTFNDDLRFGDNTYFSKISYDWKRGLEKEIVKYKDAEIIQRLIYDYNFLDTPSSGKLAIEPGNHLDAPTFPNEHHIKSVALSMAVPNENWWNVYNYPSTKLISAWFYLSKMTSVDYINGNELKTESSYFYDNPVSAQLTKQLLKYPDNTQIETAYFYAHETENTFLMEKNMIGIPLETEVKKNGVVISKSKTKYPVSQNEANSKTSGLPLPYQVDSHNLQNGEMGKQVTYDKYDSKGNLVQYTTKTGVSTTIIWGYNQTLPIAKIEGAKVADIPQTSITTIINASDYSSPSYSESNLIDQLDAFRISMPGYQISTYTYKPLIGVSSITPPSGIREIYRYDTANRLQSVVDVDGNILKEYSYQYKQ